MKPWIIFMAGWAVFFIVTWQFNQKMIIPEPGIVIHAADQDYWPSGQEDDFITAPNFATNPCGIKLEVGDVCYDSDTMVIYTGGLRSGMIISGGSIR